MYVFVVNCITIHVFVVPGPTGDMTFLKLKERKEGREREKERLREKARKEGGREKWKERRKGGWKTNSNVYFFILFCFIKVQ